MKLSHLTVGFIFFAILVGLLLFFYEGMEEQYGITQGDVKTLGLQYNNETSTGSIGDAFANMNLLEGINRLQDGFLRLRSVDNPADLLGGLLLAGLGILQTIIGLLIAPYDIANIVLTYYVGEVPGIVGGLASIVIVYASFIFLSIKVGKDL